ncbi:PD40 domain-containing protein [Crocinitomix catalasitica]|uniref:PD40 domain-containing protein n=1 Tax=Crocinitomix catalasitica TaxID=184607 RepID=UPI0004819458|nr:PD40 domain-containing protein [Crocinitomix catalasitica]
MTAQFYQGSLQEFGKSRVQFNSFGWKYHNYKRFKIYYSGINEDISIYVARTLHHYLGDAEAKLDYLFPEKLEVIVYESQSKFKQSNLGLTGDEQSNVGGTTRIVGSKIFIYYEGDHQKFNKNIKSAVYEVLLKHLFYGGDWKDQLKSTVNTGIPLWLEQGLISYFVEDWNAKTEGRVKDLILTKKIDKFNDLTDEEKMYAGHAVWNYIAETHGTTVIPNILYVTRISKNIERGFYSLLGMDFTKLTRNYIGFYRSRYIKEYQNQTEPAGELIPHKTKKESVYYSVKISPDGNKLAYVENQIGRYRIKVYNQETEKTKKLFAAEIKMERIQDYSFPVIGWHPNGMAIAFFTERKGEVLLNIHNIEAGITISKPIKGVDKVLSFEYSQDGKKIIFSGVVRGQTDLYLYDVLGNTKEQITDDIYDDLTPSFIDNGKRVIFSSNRDNDTIFKSPEIDFIDRKNDLFIYNLKEKDNTYKFLERITNTPDQNESQAKQLSRGTFVYLNDKNGLYNRFIAQNDSIISSIDTITHYRYITNINPQTNYVTNILEQDMNKSGKLVSTVYQNGKFKIFEEQTKTEILDVLWNTTYMEKRKGKKEKASKKEAMYNDTVQVENHLYQREIVIIGQDSDKVVDANDSLSIKKLAADEFIKPKFLMYKTNFTKDYVLTQLDNNFLFPNYQPYSGPGSVYFNPGMNALLKIGSSDLFDDIKLLGGVRIPVNLNSGGEFLFVIENLKNRLDHRLVLYRQKTINDNQNQPFKWLTHDVRYRMSYPITEVLSVRATINVRNDNQVFIPYNDVNLQLDNIPSYNSGLNLELVYDNTIPMELNIRRGTRFKIFAEYLQELGNNFAPTYNIGLDYRHYLRIKRNFIWVNRFATATSLGARKLLYYMGGVDNWVLRPAIDFNQDITVDPSQNFGFQTLATPMRGFIQNTRNGNSFAVFNTEFRLPVFTFFSPYPIKSEMIKHFQIIAFSDIGTAWTGPHPFHEDNYFNIQEIQDPPVIIKVKNLREPIIGSLGFGFRSKIWGYFVRLDVAWGIENLEFQKPIPYLSLSKDI